MNTIVRSEDDLKCLFDKLVVAEEKAAQALRTAMTNSGLFENLKFDKVGFNPADPTVRINLGLVGMEPCLRNGHRCDRRK